MKNNVKMIKIGIKMIYELEIKVRRRVIKVLKANSSLKINLIKEKEKKMDSQIEALEDI